MTDRRTSSHGPVARGLIVDLDDTLYPHEQFVTSGFDALARHLERRYRISRSRTRRTLQEARERGFKGRELQVLCETCRWPLAIVPQLLNVFRAHRPHLRLPLSSARVLERLRADGWRIVVLTNGIPAIQRRKVAALGLAGLTHHVVYAEEHSRGGKPAPRPFREALARLGVPAAHCVCVGDDPVTDVSGARALGIRTIRVRRAEDARTDTDADAVVSDIGELPATLAAVLDVESSHAA